ncbi:TetR/AcrR family transcriptional regulator [Telluria aromaticivorans]|uniref:TetR/AcrR family transcriptional regulator n=1 Tax=Telluria aromaticivorans TaxID=2725995 RepID=A0A7Y2JY00_9BURK|nr:TetR/AcrR family transcriptional regulator [Telluria aromaticivorans]NNG22986.1 TetR/AcrR family transcriptional regulator [Telluria aromaticivorans]
MRQKTEAKRQAILAAAGAVFREHGFETSSVSDIAARVGGSKATIYSYFPSKEALLMEVILSAAETRSVTVFSEVLALGDVVTGLRRIGEAHLSFISTAEAVALARLAITAGERSTLGREFYTRGPLVMIENLAAFLAASIARDELRPGDPRQMAESLKALYEAGIVERHLLGDLKGLEGVDLAVHAAQAVDIFLAYYGKA